MRDMEVIIRADKGSVSDRRHGRLLDQGDPHPHMLHGVHSPIHILTFRATYSSYEARVCALIAIASRLWSGPWELSPGGVGWAIVTTCARCS